MIPDPNESRVLTDADRTTISTMTSTLLAEVSRVRSARTLGELYEAMNDLETA